MCGVMVAIIESCGVVIVVGVVVLHAIVVTVVMPCSVAVVMGGIAPCGAALAVIVHRILMATHHHHRAIGAWRLEHKRGS